MTDAQAPSLIIQQRAGDIEWCLTGHTTYLAPLPLPTEVSSYSPHVSDVNDIYLDFGGGTPHVFSWQFTFGIPLTAAVLMLVGGPILLALIGAESAYDMAHTLDFMHGFFHAALPLTLWTCLLGLAVNLAVWLRHHNLYTTVIPTRFNRQRREVCFTPHGTRTPLFVPWESLSAWVVQAQGGSQYGVMRQYGMGMGFYHEDEMVRVEFQCAGMQSAIAHWEAVRAYMEYEVHDLKHLQDPMDLQGPDDPPHEGLHTFRNARTRLHRRLRDKDVGWIYGFFWYLYHVMTLWTIPNRLVEWEVRRIARIGRKKLPEAMQTWSEPLPHAQWATPSEQLVRLSKRVRDLKQRRPLRSITDIFAEVYRTEDERAASRPNAPTSIPFG